MGILDTWMETENLCFISVTCGLCEAQVDTVFPVPQFPCNTTLGLQMLQGLQDSLKYEQQPTLGQDSCSDQQCLLPYA